MIGMTRNPTSIVDKILLTKFLAIFQSPLLMASRKVMVTSQKLFLKGNGWNFYVPSVNDPFILVHRLVVCLKVEALDHPTPSHHGIWQGLHSERIMNILYSCVELRILRFATILQRYLFGLLAPCCHFVYWTPVAIKLVIVKMMFNDSFTESVLKKPYGRQNMLTVVCKWIYIRHPKKQNKAGILILLFWQLWFSWGFFLPLFLTKQYKRMQLSSNHHIEDLVHAAMVLRSEEQVWSPKWLRQAILNQVMISLIRFTLMFASEILYQLTASSLWMKSNIISMKANY